MKCRPYRHVPTEELRSAHARLFTQVQGLIANYNQSIAGAARRDLRRVAAELDHRVKR